MTKRLILFGAPFYAGLLALIIHISSVNRDAREVTQRLQMPDPKMRSTRRPVPPRVLFSEVAEASGIVFQHHNGAHGGFYLPEVMAPGAAFLDYDNDGDQDAVIVNSCNWAFHESSRGPGQPTHRVYENDGQGRFHDATADLGLAFSSYGMGVCCGDIDNDGFTDLFLAGIDGNFLLRNRDGKRFEDITDSAGVRGAGLCTSAAFLDYDRDGKLDLFVCRYVDWSPEIESQLDVFFKVAKRNFYRGPDNFSGRFCFLYHNRDGLHFEDVSGPAGIQVKDTFGRPRAKALGVAACDYNEDGWPDIAVANDRVANFLFRNLGDGRFRDVAIEAGTSHDIVGRVRAGMGIAWADYRNNGSLGLLITNFTNEACGLYLADRGMPEHFVDVAALDGIAADTRIPVSWGVCFFDYDLDGWQDLYITNGHLSLDYQEYHNIPYAQRALLFWNSGPTGRGYFWNVTSEESGPDLFLPLVGRGSAVADIDGDGDLDLLVTANIGKAKLYRNEVGREHHFFRLQLEGVESNRSAIGARVRARTGKFWQRREVTSGSSYLSQNELVLTLGLGRAAQVDELEIVWPLGRKERFLNVPGGRTWRLREGKGFDGDGPAAVPSADTASGRDGG